MEIELTSRDVLEIFPWLNVLLKKKTREDFPIQTSMKVRRIIRSFRPLVDDIQDENQKLIEQFAERDDKGEMVHFEHNGMDLIRLTDGTKVKELMDTTHEIPESLTLDDVSAFYDVTPDLLIGLGDLLID